jgi:DNA-binding MarR family transcriptional regulator
MDADQVRRVRSFNRTVSQRIGALQNNFLNRGRPLGEARLLYEIGRDGAEVRNLRARLELDSGYVSRLLRSLERQGLVKARPAANDGRVRRVKLTRKGLREASELDRRSDAFARSVLAPLGAAQRDRLIAAMAEIERLMRASAVQIKPEAPDSADARGLGVGRRMLETLEALAREFGLGTLRLDTNRTLKEAQALYRRCGYLEVEPFNDEPYAHHWFEKAGI